eukprot:g10020.t1
MSEADFNAYLYGPRNKVSKHWQNSQTCTGTNYFRGVMLATGMGKCVNSPNGSEVLFWNDTTIVTKRYKESDCSGVYTEEKTMMNVCTVKNYTQQGGGLQGETHSVNPPNNTSSSNCTAKNHSKGWPYPESGCKSSKGDCENIIEPWLCDGKYSDLCTWNSHPDYSRICLVPSNYEGSNLITGHGTCNALISFFSRKGHCLENVTWHGTDSDIQNELIDLEGKVIGGTNCRGLLRTFLGPSCCGKSQKIATFVNYSRTCLNPEKYEPFASYNGKSCDTIYQELSSYGNRFSTINWNTARKSDFSDNSPNEKISNETLLHFYSDTVGCCKDYKSILWKSPAPINGKKACEDHGFSQSQCTAVGCCQWQDSNRKCVSAVGENLCTTDSGKSCSQAASLLGYNCPPGHSPNSRCDPGCYYTPECKKDMNDCAGVTLQPIKVNALDDRSASQLMNKTNIFLKDLYAVWLEKEINTCRNNSLSFLAMCPENYPCVQDICEVNRSAYNGTSPNCSTLNVTDGSCAGSKFCRVHYNASINNLCCQNGVLKCANDALGKPYKNMLGCCNGCVNSSCSGFQIEDQLDQKLKWPRLNVCPATIGNSLKLIPGFPMDGYEYNGTCKPEKCGNQSDACYVKRDDASHVAEDFLRSNSFSFTDENINFGRNDLVSDATFYNDVRNYNDGSGYSMYRTNEAYYNKLMKMMFLRDLRVVSTEVTKVTTASLDLSWGNFSVI